MNFKQRVGENIRMYRKAKGLTIKDVAITVGLTEATMQKYEAGGIKKVDIELLHSIAKALDVTPEQLTEWQSKEEYLKHKEELYKKRRNPELEEQINHLPKSKQKDILALIDMMRRDNHVSEIVVEIEKMNSDGIERLQHYAKFLLEEGYIKNHKSGMVEKEA